MTKPSLPSFRNPPVVETVIGVQFTPPKEWSLLHFGLFWNTIRDEFHGFQLQPPLVSNIERFDQSMLKPETSVALLGPTDVDLRCWFLKGPHELIQVQKGHFIYNWRKAGADIPYPRYEAFVRPQFEKNWRKFTEFLRGEGLAPPEVIQCEATYVNHIDEGAGWETADDVRKVFTVWGGTRQPAFLGDREASSFNLNYLMPDEKGRLRVTSNMAVRKDDGKRMITLNLTVRSKPDSSDTESILECFDVAREWIVRGFADLTSDSMHEIWGRE